jgi:hypothetical protein
MADVTGDFGGQPIQLNNAATEATLKQLVQAMGILSAKVGGAKGPKEIEAEMKKFQKAMEKAQKNQEKKNKLDEESNKLTEKEIKSAKEKADADAKAIEATKLAARRQEELSEKMSRFTGSLERANSAFMGLLTDLSSMGNDLNAVAGVFKQIPLIGGVMGATFGAVAGAATKTYKAFNDAASVGANFGGSIDEMQKSVAGTGLTLDQYTTLIKTNGEALAMLGGSVGEGTKRFTQMSKAITTGNVGKELSRLGYTTEDINSGLLRYGAIITKSAGGRKVSDDELIKDTKDYLTNLDAVARLTGKNKEILAKEQEARQADAQFRVLQSKVGKEGAKNLNMLMDSMSDSEKEAAKQILATGTLSGEAAQQLQIMNPQAAKALLAASADIRKSGTLTQEGAFKIDDAFNAGAKAMDKNKAATVLATHESEKFGKSYVGQADRQARILEKDASLRKTIADQQVESQKNLNEGVKGLDPAVVKANMEKLANMTNTFMAALANSPLLEQMLNAFSSALTTVTPILLNTFSFIGEYGKGLLTAFGLLAGVTLLLNTATKLRLLQENAQSLGLGRLSKMFGLLGKGVTGLLGPIGIVITIFMLLYENFEGFATFIDDLITDIRSMLPSWAGGISADEAKRQKADRALAKSTEGVTKANEEQLRQQKQFAPGAPAAASGAPADMNSYMKAIAQIESGGNANAKSSTSSAAGLFQFTEGTWKDMTKEMGKNYTSQDRFDPAKSAEVMEHFTKKNRAQLEKGTGKQANNTDMYMAHFLGAGGATKFLNGMQVNQNQSAAQMMGDKAASANKNIFYDKSGKERSLKEVYELMGQKVAKAEGGTSTAVAGAVPGKSPASPAAGPGPVSPSASATQTALAKPEVATSASNTGLAANPIDALKQGLAGNQQTSLGGPAAAGAGAQESPAALLSNLNSKMDTLIKIQIGAKDTGEKQLRKTASGGANMDMFTNVSIA